jgi:hypothetical protein
MPLAVISLPQLTIKLESFNNNKNLRLFILLAKLLSKKRLTAIIWNLLNFLIIFKTLNACPFLQQEIILQFVKKLKIKIFYYLIFMDLKLETLKLNTLNFLKLKNNLPLK